jgi:peptidoglycan hydrolase-like protein with peptidoglycan-binding domain
MRRAIFIGGLALGGLVACAPAPRVDDPLLARVLANQTQLGEQLAASQRELIDAAGEALGQAQAARQQIEAVRSELKPLAEQLQALKQALGTLHAEQATLRDSLKTVQQTVEELASDGAPLVIVRVPVPNAPLARTARGAAVLELTRALILVGVMAPLTDRYTAGVADAVKQFQRARQLKVTGYYDEATATELRRCLWNGWTVATSRNGQTPARHTPEAPEPPPQQRDAKPTLPAAPPSAPSAKPVAIQRTP